jgi:ABC-type nitrate/sulfonate/bicarbonate transport system substrate-binding protein
MRVRSVSMPLVFLLFVTTVCPVSLFGAAAPHKATFTYGGLNERSGILWVARDAGIFQKHGLDATIGILE